ncbi:MAG TPA: ribose 5-phosphate isomerase B [Candidatus Paceibacterota bacterium]|nr:ribose 5-phosphate isomerase B [Candidatus Paceibacterota bacterium]
MIYLGADHRGHNLKEEIKKFFELEKIEFKDLGNLNYDENDDYPDFVKKVVERVLSKPKKDKGILICGTGIGMSIAANKFKGIKAGLCLSGYMAKRAIEEDDINILCLAADITDVGTSKKIIKEWLKAKFKNEERYKRRIKKILEIEKLN